MSAVGIGPRYEVRVGVIRAAIVSAMLTTAVTGCGEAGPELIPVKGRVTLDGKPATEGAVVFHDASNGLRKLIGAIGPDGNYSIMQNREPGAAAGEYRVTVLVTETAKGPDGEPTGLPKTLSNRKFFDVNQSPLKVAVKVDASPGAYDLAVTP